MQNFKTCNFKTANCFSKHHRTNYDHNFHSKICLIGVGEDILNYAETLNKNYKYQIS